MNEHGFSRKLLRKNVLTCELGLKVEIYVLKWKNHELLFYMHSIY